MELFLTGLILLVNTALIIVVMQNRTKVVKPELIELEAASCNCDVVLSEIFKLRELIDTLDNKVSIPVPPPPDESHFAWKNRKEEPRKAPPSPHKPPPKPGPLERPSGFPL